MLSRFHLILERQEQTDRQTDGHICYINTARQCADVLYFDQYLTLESMTVGASSDVSI